MELVSQKEFSISWEMPGVTDVQLLIMVSEYSLLLQSRIMMHCQKRAKYM